MSFFRNYSGLPPSTGAKKRVEAKGADPSSHLFLNRIKQPEHGERETAVNGGPPLLAFLTLSSSPFSRNDL
jgi:hypothetical protein